MFEPDVIRKLLELDESPILEFKREWYWNSASENGDLGSKWGEFLKDIIALCNGYINFTGHDRHLIIGYCEKERAIYNVDMTLVKILQDMREFRKKIIERLEKLVNFPPLSLQIEPVIIDGNTLLVFRIPSPKHLTELKNELTTKTRTLDSGAVLVRKGQEADSVRAANPLEIKELQAEFEKFKGTSLSTSIVSASKDRSIARTVQLYIEKNTSFSIDLGFPIAIRADNVIFELFKISEELGSSKYFLYIHENASQSTTFGYLKKQNLLGNDIPLIILTERPSIKDTGKRKDNISKIFGTKHVYFIDEFGLNYLYRDFIQDYESYNLPVFVESLTEEDYDGDKSALRILNTWYESVAAPLMVIKGYGGIGKSTLAKQFLDNVGDRNNDIGLIFIDSNDIVDRLSKITRAGKKIDDLYDFYIAQQQEAEIDTKNFSKDLLKLSVDNGSLLIVLDGIDEVIAKLGSKFDVASFVKSIIDSYSNNLERGKVLITCRDNFWRDLDDDKSIKSITLSPFNMSLARDFFCQAFDSMPVKVERAMNMADKFAITDSGTEAKEMVYIPYVLDMIAYLIKHKQVFGDENVKLGSETKMLLPGVISNDFLIGSVCEREIKKLGNCSIDDQINFLIDFSASALTGHVSIYDVKGLFESATGIQINDEFVEKLKEHPLLSYANNALNFRYDFFYQYFKSLYVARYFDKKVISTTAATIDIFGTYVGFDNDFTRSLSKRILFSEESLLFSMETIEALKIKLQYAIDSEKMPIKSAISGLFVLLLSLKYNEKQSLDIEDCTNLLKQVFLLNGVLNGVALIRVFSSERAKVVFDFRDIATTGAHFEQYEYFWDCLMDEKTRFFNSNFVALDPRAGVKPPIFNDTFHNCDIVDIADVINRRKLEVISVVDELKERLYQFFKLFYKQGNFYPKKQDDVRARLYTGKLLPTLLKNKVVIDYHDPKKGALRQYKITDEFRPIIKLFEQGGASLEFERVVHMFK